MSARTQVNRVSGNEIERLLPVLVHIQANLDQELSLEVLFAETTHVGHYRTLPEAYATIARRAARLKGYRVGGLPCIEFYRTTRVDANHEMNHTEIYIPVSRVGK